MIIVDKQTLETFEQHEVAAMFPHIMFDFSEPEIVGEVLDGLGLAVLIMPDQPMHDSRYQAVTVGGVTENNGEYHGDWVLSYIDLTQEQRRELIAAHRYEVETGGVEVAGHQIPTDRHTQQVLTAMYMRAKSDSEYLVRFKTGAGFVNLSASQIIVIAESVHDHVQAAFAREDDMLIAIEQGEPITPDDWA